MKDERKQCANCNHKHPWGILRYSMDNTPLYGARRCWCHCDSFVAVVEGNENLPATTQKETEALWAATSFLSAQVPAATRIAVRKITQLMASGTGPCKTCGHDKDDHTDGTMFCRCPSAYPTCECPRYVGEPNTELLLTAALPEFAGLLISQITDIRGAMIRDESKFAHLVAHTDEIVGSMRGVAQLNEQLMVLGRNTNDMAVRLDKLETLVGKIAEAVGVLEPLEPETSIVDNVATLESQVSRQEARATFFDATRSLWNEPIVTDAEPADD